MSLYLYSVVSYEYAIVDESLAKFALLVQFSGDIVETVSTHVSHLLFGGSI